MRRLTRIAQMFIAAILVLVLAAACGSGDTGGEAGSSELTYLPRAGDFVLIFTHRFNEADYEKGKQIVIDGFSAAIDASGQTRRTYFLENETESEFMAISYFHSDSSTDEWLSSAGREEVLAQLEPLYRQPLEIQHLVVEEVHDTQ